MDNTLLIVVSDAERAAKDNGGTIEERFTAAMKVCKNHWMVTNEDNQFRGCVGGVMSSYKDDSPEYQRIKKEMGMLKQFSAMIAAAQTGLVCQPPEVEEGHEPIGLMKLWKEGVTKTKEENSNDNQHTKVANCSIWEPGKQCEFVVGWMCLDQCCAIPPISNRL